jgi:hypothetical protein
MKVTEESVATIATWTGLALLVIAANLSSPPWELTLPAWLIFGTGIGIRISRAPEDDPYKRAFFVMAIPLVILLPASAFGRDFFLLLTHPSMAHLVMPRPFLVTAILYLGLACVFLNIKIQRLQRDMVDQKQRYADLLDTLAGRKTLDMFTPTEVLNIDIERLAGDIRDYKKRYAEIRNAYLTRKQHEEL